MQTIETLVLYSFLMLILFFIVFLSLVFLFLTAILPCFPPFIFIISHVLYFFIFLFLQFLIFLRVHFFFFNMFLSGSRPHLMSLFWLFINLSPISLSSSLLTIYLPLYLALSISPSFLLSLSIYPLSLSLSPTLSYSMYVPLSICALFLCAPKD